MRADSSRRRIVGLRLAALPLCALLAVAAWRCSGSADNTPKSSAGDSVSFVNAYATELPDGPGRKRVEDGCLGCHSAMLITQQHKDSTAWEKTLTLMDAWGSTSDSAGRAELRGYLVDHFGPVPARPDSAAPSRSK